MTIHLIRHGKTHANQQRLYCGHTNIPLSSEGLAELEEYKNQNIYPTNIDLFISSGLLRTTQTINHIYGTVCCETIPELAEYNFGKFEMKSYEELKEQEDYQAWISDNTGTIACPKGESKQAFTSRILKGYDLLLKKAENNTHVLLTSHGGVISSLMEHLFPNTRNFYEWQPKPGCGYTLEYSNGICSYTNISNC